MQGKRTKLKKYYCMLNVEFIDTLWIPAYRQAG